MIPVTSKPAGLRRLGILGAPQGPFVRELAQAALRRNPKVELSLLSFSELTVKLDGPRVSVSSQRADALEAGDQASGQVDLLGLDGLVVRTMPVGSLEQVIFRMDALQAVEHAGVPVLNPPRALEVAIDKWLTLERLSRFGIATPATWACQTRAAAMEAFEMLGGDVVVKPLFGGEGRGLVRLTDPDMAWRVFGTLTQLGNVLYVQQFIPNFGYDIRVLLVGQRCLSIKRRAASGGWRTNISQGCAAEPHALTADEEQLAWSAAQVTGGSLLGVDLLPARDGRTVVLEVNAVPGWKGTAAALGVDVADLVIQHVEELHVQRS